MMFTLKDCAFSFCVICLIAGMVGLNAEHRDSERVMREQVHDQLKYARDYYYNSMSSIEQDDVRAEIQLLQAQVNQLQAEVVDLERLAHVAENGR